MAEAMKNLYVSIATKKKSGDWVWTPVWFARTSGEQSIYIFSAASAGKVKRLKNFETVQIAPCTISGSITGESKSGLGRLIYDEKEVAQGTRYSDQNMVGKSRFSTFSAALLGISISAR